jgi:hypothetical protein
MVKKQSLSDAKIDFKRLGFDKNKDFFELNQKEKEILQSLLDITKYSKPKGKSKLRGFWETLSK